LAPGVFGETGETSFVHTQPKLPHERRQALQALLACPTGSIGTLGDDDPRTAMRDFPLTIEEPVSYCGFNSRKSYGGNSYFIHDPKGNWLIDSPKYLGPLANEIERRGGLSYIFLTHRDDVADAAQYAKRFAARRIIHRKELAFQPDAEMQIEGDAPVEIAPGYVVIPTPGHTAGHCCLLFRNRFLFTGDHLDWDRDEQRLAASEDYCWHSWRQQIDSIERLASYDFEWILPGHGQRVHLPLPEMQEQMRRLVRDLRNGS
jgi:glyoxylase-like metal-dependent hydrolase (beta-lactamase superfamily II)